MTNTIKKGALVGLLCAILGAIQMFWFLPNGQSCLDARSGLLDAIFVFMSLQFFLVVIIYVIIRTRLRFYILIALLCTFWFFVNKNEFTYRLACWSTYTTSDILYYTFQKSIIPIATCISIFIVGYLYLGKLTVRNDIEKNN
ncbi:MFS transporter [Tenacibaculum finnmarkense]|uniref:hypothetical protein n=1 Tax=Tenacibaculum finnmarkense TaxID=2781243 RepID=UPI001EFA6756|nr:hypothetical protein [Tenacibaculum finnmarkense]MCG8894618.1 MFS transporter [Tenacibaculum finnmarkense]MCG8902758.1 MFS transporter [Tenacibaculum finnmarkense]